MFHSLRFSTRALLACSIPLTGIFVISLLSFAIMPGFTEDKPLIEKHPKPYSKQIYLEMPAYLEALSKEKKAKQEAKLAAKASKKTEKKAKAGDIMDAHPPTTTQPVTEEAFVRYVPYQPGKELNLWMLEAKKFFRSEPVLPPDRSGYVYTEVAYIPYNRQTFSRLFWVSLTDLPEEAPLRPSEDPGTSQTQEASFYQNRLNPDKTTPIRQELLGVGNNRPIRYEFRTLTIVDWSANSRKLLFKQRSGVIHMGLKVSDILVYDRGGGTVTIYPELQRVLQHYWLNNSNLPDLDTVAWDIYPIGWAPGSDSEVVFKAWAYDNKNPRGHRVFLGIWQYDINAQRSTLITRDDSTYPLPVNGIVPDFVTKPAEPVPTLSPYLTEPPDKK